MLKHTSLLISPSTGTSHLADNLKIPTLWLASKVDTSLWKGDNMDTSLFVVLKSPTKKMSKTQEYRYVKQVEEILSKIFK